MKSKAMNATDNPQPNNGIVNSASPYGVTETVDRLLALFQSTGMKIFARIDQQLEAQAVGLSMLPTCVLIFGDPRVGTALMNQFPSLALDLPLKVLVWQDISGSVWVSYKQRGLSATAPQPARNAIQGLRWADRAIIGLIFCGSSTCQKISIRSRFKGRA